MPGPLVDVEPYRREIVRLAPEFSGARVAWLGEGAENVAFLVGEAYVFRFARHREAAGHIAVEARLYPLIASRLILPIPRYEYIGTQSGTGLPFVGYRHIVGEELRPEVVAGLSPAVRGRVASELARFVAALHAIPADEAREAGIGEADDRADALALIDEARARLFPTLDVTTRRFVERSFLDYLDEPSHFAFRPALLHSDLAPEHVLMTPDRTRLAGVLDFDPLLGDPDYDLLYPFWLGLGDAFLNDYAHPDPARLEIKLAFADLRETVNDALDRADSAFLS